MKQDLFSGGNLGFYLDSYLFNHFFRDKYLEKKGVFEFLTELSYFNHGDESIS